MLSIIIPVYNEKEFIREVLRKVKTIRMEKEIIVIDDCSTDGTIDVLEEEKGITLIRHQVNQGKGAAVRSGIRRAKGEYMVIQDSDLEYDPSDIERMHNLVKNKQLPALYGSRFKGGGQFLLQSFIANKFLTFMTNLLYGANITDMETCYKMIKSNIMKTLDLQANGFDMEPEITAKLIRRGIKIREIPIHYSGRKYQEGKKIDWRDGVIAILALLKWKFK